MSDVLSNQHLPALRVGGRRLSTSARPRPHTAPGTGTPANGSQATDTDYPRPHTQGDSEDQTQMHPPLHNEEEPPKKDKKRGHGSHDQNRLKESMHHKLEATTPARDHSVAKHSFGASGRIGQPMGRALAV